MERSFLGWDAPALASASGWLLDRVGADLREFVVVVPGGRVRRMLVGALVDAADARGVALTPPLVITPGEIPATLLGPSGRPAPAIARRLAWVDALRSLERGDVAPLLPRPLEGDDLPGWSRIGAALERASDELAGEGLRFADVPERAGASLPPEEHERWLALARVQDRASELLAAQGLVDDALATCAQALAGDMRRDAPARVVLLGVAELNRVERLAIQRGASAVDALVFAPATLADRFDDFGCIRVESWAAAPVDLEERRVVFASDPHEQAERALVLLAERGAPVDAGEVVIGLADPEALAHLRRRATSAADVVVRSSLGESAARTLPGSLLRLLGASLREPGFESMCALVRHPDVELALLALAEREGRPAQAEWWLAPLDAIRREHVLTDPASPPPAMWRERREALEFVRRGLGSLFGGPLRERGATRPLDEWADSLAAALGAVYAGRSLDPTSDADRKTIEALEALRGAFDELAGASRAEETTTRATAWQAVALVEERLATQFVPEAARRDAIEALGWLELSLDPAPVCVVVGMAESCVPGSVTHDALLPDTLRANLGLRTNEARLARDAFLLSAINASRDATFIATRTSEDGDPRTPSRLLFRCTGRRLAERVRRFTQPEVDAQVGARLASRLAPGAVDRFAPALRIGPDYAPPQAMSVTDFGAYLRSPAGWYLERCLGLVEHEAPRELSAMLFGSLAHAALESFGRDESARELDDPARISDALSDLLTSAASRLFGERPPAPVRIQTELLRERLRLLGPWQADRRREGWRIAHVEWKPARDAGVRLEVDGSPMGLRGKIDRIDVHESDGAMALLDYKTGAGATNVMLAHRGRDNRWKSLQLPLYRHLVGPLGPARGVQMGYVGLPSSGKNASPLSEASWTEQDLLDADEEARRIVRCIRAYAPGAAIEAGDHPPDAGSLGFVTGARFDVGGRTGDDEDDDTEEAA